MAGTEKVAAHGVCWLQMRSKEHPQALCGISGAARGMRRQSQRAQGACRSQ